MANGCLTSMGVIGPVLLLLGSAVAAQPAAPAPRLLGVRVIKVVPGLTNKAPSITIPGAEDACEPGGYHGENIKEFYFDVEVARSVKTPPTARFACQGVEVARVRVGHTKVAFEKRQDGSVTFPLVFDERNPYTLHMQNREVPAVLLYAMHKPRDRASGPAFRDVPWQPDAVAAEWNLLYGCLEIFRDMNIGDPATKDFDGHVAIGGYETTYPRTGRGPHGHVEGTAHIHLFLVVPPGWRIRQASHLYIDGQGRLTGKVHCGPSACEEPPREYEQGMICAQRDFNDRVAFEFRIEADGALMIRRGAGAVEYRVRPHSTTRSFADGAQIVKGAKPLGRVKVRDDCQAGEMRIERTRLGGAAPESHEEIIRYDPDTSAVLSQTRKRRGTRRPVAKTTATRCCQALRGRGHRLAGRKLADRGGYFSCSRSHPGRFVVIPSTPIAARRAAVAGSSTVQT